MELLARLEAAETDVTALCDAAPVLARLALAPRTPAMQNALVRVVRSIDAAPDTAAADELRRELDVGVCELVALDSLCPQGHISGNSALRVAPGRPAGWLEGAVALPPLLQVLWRHSSEVGDLLTRSLLDATVALEAATASFNGLAMPSLPTEACFAVTELARALGTLMRAAPVRAADGAEADSRLDGSFAALHQCAMRILLLPGVDSTSASAAAGMVAGCAESTPSTAAATILDAMKEVREKGAEFTLAAAMRGLMQRCKPETVLGPSHSASGEFTLLRFLEREIVRSCKAPGQQHRINGFRALDGLLQQVSKGDIDASASAVLANEVGSLENVAMQLVWDQWELATSSIAPVLTSIFKRLIALRGSRFGGAESIKGPPPWLLELLPRIKALPLSRKCRHRSLSAMLPLIPGGAQILLDAWPTLWTELFASFNHNRDQSPTYSGSLIKELFNSLHQAEHSDDAAPHWTEQVLQPMLAFLPAATPFTMESLLRVVLPPLLEVSPGALESLLTLAADAMRPCDEGAVAKLTHSQGLRLVISTLRVARSTAGSRTQLSLYEVDARFASSHWPLPCLSNKLNFPAGSLLTSALFCDDDDVSLGTLQIICDPGRQTEPPTTYEMELLRAFVPLHLGSSSGHAFRQAASRQLHGWLVRLQRSTFISAATKRGLKGTQAGGPRNAGLAAAESRRELGGLVREWLQWYAGTLVAALFPGCSSERAMLAMQLLEKLHEVWGQAPAAYIKVKGTDPRETFAWPLGFSPLNAMAARSLLMLLSHKYEPVRTMALTLLSRFDDGSLPCLGDAGGVDAARVHSSLVGALRQLSSPLSHESEGGEYVHRVLFSRYVLGLGWSFRLSAELRLDSVQVQTGDNGEESGASFAWLDDLSAALSAALCTARSPPAGDGHGEPHGLLAAMRSALLELESASALVSTAIRQQLRPTLATFLKLACASIDQALAILAGGREIVGKAAPDTSRPAVGIIDSGGGSIADWGFLGGLTSNVAPLPSLLAAKGKQTVVRNWLALKEAFSLIALVVTVALRDGRAPMLTSPELDAVTQQLIMALLTTRHNGAIDAGALALEKVCTAALLSTATRQLPAAWLHGLLETADMGKGTHLRRSAGLPDALIAVLHAEKSSPSRTAPLFATAAAFLLRRAQELSVTPEASVTPVVEEDTDVGRVHAINLLRAIFCDGRLSFQSNGFVSSGFEAAFSGLGSKNWNVRNAALLLLTALIDRSTCNGHKNESAGGATRAGIRDFLARSPRLLPLLLEVLRHVAPDVSVDVSDGKPDVYAVLLLLSRLEPSPSEDEDDELCVEPLLPFVLGCGRHPAHRVRVAASRALVPLVAPERVLSTITSIVQKLPSAQPITNHNDAHSMLLGIHSLLEAALLRTIDVDSKAAMARASLEALDPAFWLLSESQKFCPPIHAQLLATLELALRHVAQGSDVEPISERVLTEITKVSAVALDPTAAAASELFAGEAARVLAIVARLHCLQMHGAATEMVCLLLKAAADTTYEIRLTALLHSRALLGLAPDDATDASIIVVPAQAKLGCPVTLESAERASILRSIVNLVNDGQPELALRALRTVADAYSALGVCCVAPGDRRALSASAFALLSHADPQVRAAALVLLAEGDGETSDLCLGFIDECGDASQPEDVREASTRALLSLAAFARLDNSESPFLPKTIKAWLLALRAVEDDSPCVRAIAARGLMARLSPRTSIALHPAAVAVLGWTKLTAEFAREPDMLEALYLRVSGTSLLPADGTSPVALPTDEGEVGVEWIFKQEEANLYVETYSQIVSTAPLLRDALDRCVATASSKVCDESVLSAFRQRRQQLARLSVRTAMDTDERHIFYTRRRLLSWALSGV